MIESGSLPSIVEYELGRSAPGLRSSWIHPPSQTIPSTEIVWANQGLDDCPDKFRLKIHQSRHE